MTHLFESLTGKDWRVHGESKYCCFSVYQKLDTEEDWNPLLVNQTTYDGGKDETDMTTQQE